MNKIWLNSGRGCILILFGTVAAAQQKNTRHAAKRTWVQVLLEADFSILSIFVGSGGGLVVSALAF